MFLYIISRSPVHPCLYQEIRPKVVKINMEDIIVGNYIVIAEDLRTCVEPTLMRETLPV